MLLCMSCYTKEKEYQSPANQDARLVQAKADGIIPSGILKIGDILDKARAIDYSIQLRDDIHNAETIAHSEIFAAIDSDIAIPADQKQFEKAKFLNDRVNHYQQVIFEAQAVIVEHENRKRVAQQKVNELVNTLRKEEREKLITVSPDYKPGVVKTARETKPRASKVRTLDKKGLVEEANKLHAAGYTQVDLSMLQRTCVARQMTPAQAADFLRKTFDGVA